MKRTVVVLLVFVALLGGMGAFGTAFVVVSKAFLQVVIPFGLVIWINRRDYWFHHMFRKIDHVNRHALIILLLFFAVNAGVDLLWLQGASFLILSLVSPVAFVVSFCFWRMFLEKGFRRFYRIHFGRASVYLLIHMALWGLYAMAMRAYGESEGLSNYATSVAVLGGIMLVVVFFTWGKHDHKVDPPTVEGMVRKLW
ncbi:hypothetical protein [Salimicrobium halophilum]|uniref:Uncharacterized protein n=1 Tax=Salimicrobium halophilum TaxID=86666 RepID=A0A1G8UCD1_9BACI|nr:hypothetical protein [Salimicrobium halophilum]SDJ51382.1 hypothetical protein SAMN04490247_2172 [Salimicrobium halophilum]